MPRKSQTCNICWQSGCSICPIHLQSTSMSSCPTKSKQDVPNTHWPINKEQSSLVLRAIVLAQHPGESRTDPGRPEVVMHRANDTLQHHEQHPYGLHQRSQRKRTACPLVKLIPQYGGIVLPPGTCLHLCQGITVPSCTKPKICVLGLI